MKVLFIAISFFITSAAVCQISHPSEVKDSTDIYYQCLRAHLTLIGERKEVYVEERPFITEGLPLKIDNIVIHYVSEKQMLNNDKFKKPVYVIGVNQINGNDAGLTLEIGDFGIRRKGKFLFSSATGGSTFSINYDCDTQKYNVKLLRSGGL